MLSKEGVLRLLFPGSTAGSAVNTTMRGSSALYSGVTCDSRLVKSNFIFVALNGSSTDGSTYIDEAQKKGATLVVSEQTTEGQLEVGNARLAYSLLCEAFARYPSSRMKHIAITGTNGKTTCTYLIHHLLQQAKCTAARFGTQFHHIADCEIPSSHTTPSSDLLQNLFVQCNEHNVKVTCLEVSSHGLDQHRLGSLKFDVAIFTNLTQDHLDYHETMENYYLSKKTLFTDHLKEAGLALINIDCSYGQRLLQELKNYPFLIKTYGYHPEASIQIFQDDPHNSELFTLCLNEQDISVLSPLIGNYNYRNITASLAACSFILNRSLEESLTLLKKFSGVPGRLQRVQEWMRGQVFIDYAHTPDALESTLKTLRPYCLGKLHLVFGCGGDRDRSKRALMARAAEMFADVIFLTDDNPRQESPEQIIEDTVLGFSKEADIKVIHNRRESIEQALKALVHNDVLLIAGKGSEDYQIYGTKKLPFSDFSSVLNAQKAGL